MLPVYSAYRLMSSKDKSPVSHSFLFVLNLTLNASIELNGELKEVIEHPAGDHGVEAHQADVAKQGKTTVNVPFLTGFLELLIHTHGAGLGGATHGELHNHNGQTEENKAEDIDKNKSAAAVLAGEPGEFPNVAAADGAAGAQKDKAKTASQSFSFHFNLS